MKNENYISWDAYFMGIALLSSKRSKDPNTRVGACLVSPDKFSLLATMECPLAVLTMNTHGNEKRKIHLIQNISMYAMQK